MSLILIPSFIVLAIHVLVLADIVRGLHCMHGLGAVPACHDQPAPLVSIIVPACNEEKTIASALSSLQRQSYPNFEIIVVNDRSTDGTAALLARLQEEAGRPFTVLTISKLPGGWLGKSHALQYGADHATGNFLLFTDADIEMEPTTVSRAVRIMEEQQLDHLALMFQQVGGNWLVNGMILDAAGGLLALFKPWQAEVEASHRFMGVGAFNMIRSQVYRAVSGHRPIALHPIDDIMLGRIIKENGFRQKCMLGQPFVSVCGYGNAAGMVAVLMKNFFSVVHYRGWLAMLSMVVVFTLTILPLAGLIFANGVPQLLCGATVFLRCAALAAGAKLAGMPASAIAGGILAPCLSIYTIGRGTWLTLRQGGIYWRGSFYSLAELRRSRPLLF